MQNLDYFRQMGSSMASTSHELDAEGSFFEYVDGQITDLVSGIETRLSSTEEERRLLFNIIDNLAKKAFGKNGVQA